MINLIIILILSGADSFVDTTLDGDLGTQCALNLWKREENICMAQRASSEMRRMWSNATLRVFRKLHVPTSQAWCICRNCVYEMNGDFVAYAGSNVNASGNVDVSWSRYGEFFYGKDNRDRFSVAVRNSSIPFSSNADFYIVERPVFIVSLITIHYKNI